MRIIHRSTTTNEERNEFIRIYSFPSQFAVLSQFAVVSRNRTGVIPNVAPQKSARNPNCKPIRISLRLVNIFNLCGNLQLNEQLPSSTHKSGKYGDLDLATANSASANDPGTYSYLNERVDTGERPFIAGILRRINCQVASCSTHCPEALCACGILVCWHHDTAKQNRPAAALCWEQIMTQ